jgi:splicing factor 3B subunit 2
MPLSAAERNRRKRERKKKAVSNGERPEDPIVGVSDRNARALDDVEIEYIEEAIPQEDGDMNAAVEAVRRFQARVSVAVVSSDEGDGISGASAENPGSKDDEDDNKEESEGWSKRKLRDMIRPTVAQLKLHVSRPDLVEAHDVTSADPEFLIRLKSVPGTVPVPRHWGRKRKYLQGKRGFEKPPFKLPAFLVNTGITELRDTVMHAESSMSAKQKNRARVQVKLGAIDVDYRTLYDAFFKHQTKPTGLTRFGDLYYEGKELEVGRKIVVGKPLSSALRAALGMTGPTSPPPWLINMQRYGPPPSYPSLKIPGLNAPLPHPDCQYGYHPSGWGKPPVDIYGRPLYGGNPFDPPGSKLDESTQYGDLVTSDGKTVSKADWGALPTGEPMRQDEDEEESSDDEMEESSEDEEIEEGLADGMESTLPSPSFPSTTDPVDLRKTGLETPMSVVGKAADAPKQLYTVLEQRQAVSAGNVVFASEIAYAVPVGMATEAQGGAESVLSKALPARETKRVKDDDDDDDDLGKNFKF